MQSNHRIKIIKVDTMNSNENKQVSDEVQKLTDRWEYLTLELEMCEAKLATLKDSIARAKRKLDEAIKASKGQ
jgi:predicted nuclease with TOPRIM domain